MRAKTALLLLIVPVAASALALSRPAPAPAHADVRLENVPHVRQLPDFCGEACAAMALGRLGYRVDQRDVFNLAGIDPALGRGAHTAELARALERIGFEVGQVWHPIEPARAAEQVEAAFNSMLDDLRRGFPSIVCMRYADEPSTSEHFRLVVGYAAEGDAVLYHEPAESGGAYRRMARELFEKLWTFKPRPERWTLIRLRLEPNRPAEGRSLSGPLVRGLEPPHIAIARESESPRAADLAQHVLALKARLAGERLTVVVQPPFVVVGDEAPAKVRARAEQTVAWARRLLRKDFFERDPEEITDVFLFDGRESYERHARSLFGDLPKTPYGYYSPSNRAMIMNIAPGAGTLVHELVHPYVHANFPACPAWLNEGLASLFERPGEVDGHLRGFPNWRLPALQRAIRAQALSTFERLTALSDEEFYRDAKGTHYAQARYLCYWLQERGLLVPFVHRFQAAAGDDPTGYKTLRAIIGAADMASWQLDWERFVLSLRVG
jgi:hypothetical protein